MASKTGVSKKTDKDSNEDRQKHTFYRAKKTRVSKTTDRANNEDRSKTDKGTHFTGHKKLGYSKRETETAMKTEVRQTWTYI